MKIDRYYCDRCGLEIKNIFSQKKDEYHPDLVQNYSKSLNGFYRLDVLHLCDECRKSFYEWWDGVS